jgi:hypothetical protein
MPEPAMGTPTIKINFSTPKQTATTHRIAKTTTKLRESVPFAVALIISGRNPNMTRYANIVRTKSHSYFRKAAFSYADATRRRVKEQVFFI